MMSLQRDIDSEDKDHWFWGTEKHDQLFSKLGYAFVCAQSLCRVRHFLTSWTVAARLLCLWDFPGKNTGVGCHFLLQGIFPTRDRTRFSFVSCIGRWILQHWATREAHILGNRMDKRQPDYKMSRNEWGWGRRTWIKAWISRPIFSSPCYS